MKEFIAAVIVLAFLLLMHAFEPTHERTVPQTAENQAGPCDTARTVVNYLMPFSANHELPTAILDFCGCEQDNAQALKE